MSNANKDNKNPNTDKKTNPKDVETPKSAEVVELDDLTLDDVVGGYKLPPDESNNCNC